MKKIYLSLATVLMLCSCDGFKSREAFHLLQEAREATSSQHYDSARNLIDSIRTLYPRQFDARRAALAFADTIELEQARHDLIIADSVLTFAAFEMEDCKKAFVFEKQPKYQTVGYYVLPECAGSKTSLSFFPEVEENGKLLLVSIDKNRKYEFTEVPVDELHDVADDYGNLHLSPEQKMQVDVCATLAQLMHKHQSAREEKEKLELKVRFFEKKIKEVR